MKKSVQSNGAPPQRKKSAWKIFGLIMLLAQIGCDLFALFQLKRLNMLPGKYLAMIGVFFLAVLILEFALIFVGRKTKDGRKKGPGIGRKIIAVILVIVFCATSIYVGDVASKADRTVDAITTVETSPIRAVIGVYVKADDPAQQLSDCKGYSFGTMHSEYDSAYTMATVNEVGEIIGETLSPTEFESGEELATALLSGQTKAIIMNESYAAMIDETEGFTGDFANNARLIYECDITDEKLATLGIDAPDVIEDSSEGVEDLTAEPFILYISGNDTRSRLLKVSRSDVNILMVVNPATKQILLINTPRDYYIPNPVSSSGTKDKLTHLANYGVDCSIQGLETLYDCDINYYCQLNFTGFETLIDDIGGISFYNPVGFNSGNVRGYSFSKGDITLDGEEALVYARERYAFADGDNMRGQNQMRIIKAIIAKMTSGTSVLTNYSTIMEDMTGMFITDFTSEEIQDLVRMQLDDMSEWNVQSYAVTGTGGYAITYSMRGTKLYVMYPDQASVDRAEELIDAVISGQTLTEEDVK
ncbi:MAG: LCP family protein [Saccharofermentans sp.]|nr:LCP family protein [Saccharofermentans sp.]